MIIEVQTRLAGRVALVTGVSRRAGIGFAIAQRLLAEGASVLAHSWTPHDVDNRWGADPGGIDAVLTALGGLGERLDHVQADLGDAEAPAAVVERAVSRFGGIDILVANHAHSSHQSLTDMTVDELDRAWAVNARATLLLVQAFAAEHDDARPSGSAVLFTSGQHLAPMAGEVPYAVSKGAVHQMTLTLSDALAERRIRVNAVNPGPTDTGWASPQLKTRVERAEPMGRWGTPDDAAATVAWLVSDDSAWVTGQVINAEGGFRRWVD